MQPKPDLFITWIGEGFDPAVVGQIERSIAARQLVLLYHPRQFPLGEVPGLAPLLSSRQVITSLDPDGSGAASFSARLLRDREIARPGPSWQPEGYVYLLRAENGLYKIGRSRDVSGRIKQLGIQVPFELELVHHFPADDSSTAERFEHENYAHRRVKGEWFRLDEQDLFWFQMTDIWRYNCPWSAWIGQLGDVSRYRGPRLDD